MSGLYIVSTPIGNLKDITLRAIETLKIADLVFAEDTRVTKKLLSHLGIKKKIHLLNDHNEEKVTEKILTDLFNERIVALVADAGTPLISDPGFRLVKKTRERSFDVIPIPGCCAAIAALTASGMATNRFYFHGFLPRAELEKSKELERLALCQETMIFYESVHRLQATITTMCQVFGEDRKGVVCKEITKLHEHFIGSTLAEIDAFISDNPTKIKGEFVLIVDGVKNQKSSKNFDQVDKILVELLSEMSIKKAVKICRIITDYSRNDIYHRALEIKPH
jgi:16S rRNA (cytidine1402-2'-O)-methyltransferase